MSAYKIEEDVVGIVCGACGRDFTAPLSALNVRGSMVVFPACACGAWTEVRVGRPDEKFQGATRERQVLYQTLHQRAVAAGADPGDGAPTAYPLVSSEKTVTAPVHTRLKGKGDN